MIANSLPFKVQITWWLKPVRLCLPEKSVCPGEAQFQTGINVPSTTSDPGTFLRVSSAGTLNSGSCVSAFSLAVDGSGNCGLRDREDIG